MKTPVNKEILQNHWNYSWWKYLFLVVIAIFGWNLIYTTTAYRPPENKKVVLLADCMGKDVQLDAYLERVRQNEMADMEQVNSMLVFMDETYGEMQLSTYIAAGEGDIYVLNKSHFQAYASQGAFMPLETLEGVVEYCEAQGMDLRKGWRVDSELHERHLYGIPMSYLPHLKSFLYTTEECYLSIIVNNQNQENVEKLFNILLRDMVASATTPTDLLTPPAQ